MRQRISVALQNQPDSIKAPRGQILSADIKIYAAAVSEIKTEISVFNGIQLEQQLPVLKGILFCLADILFWNIFPGTAIMSPADQLAGAGHIILNNIGPAEQPVEGCRLCIGHFTFLKFLAALLELFAEDIPAVLAGCATSGKAMEKS